MHFAPEPPNDFKDFINTYYEECARRVPKIEAIAGKWTFEDLIPGMSDFDTRFICSNGMEADDWCRMSSEVGDAHLKLCKLYPKWARILEHLPGINLTWNELEDDATYYPEYKQWTFYGTNNSAALEKALSVLDARVWENRDEYFHLKKFILYFTPYNRSIDPAVNLGIYENKYPLHSRIMHYFNPPVQSAVSIILKRSIRGKKEAFRLAKALFPELDAISEAMELADRHYEDNEIGTDPGLAGFEDRLHAALKTIFHELKKHVTIIKGCEAMDEKQIKTELSKVQVPPALHIFDNSKFSRLMKGRLIFYAKSPVHFDSTWPIQNELLRIGNNFYKVPYRTFWKLLTGETVENPDSIVRKLVPEYLTAREADATLEFSALTPGKWEAGMERETALRIAAVFDDFFRGLHKLSRRTAEISQYPK